MFVQCKIVLKNFEKHVEEEFVKNLPLFHFSHKISSLNDDDDKMHKFFSLFIRNDKLSPEKHKNRQQETHRHSNSENCTQKTAPSLLFLLNLPDKVREEEKFLQLQHSVFFFFFSLRKVQLRQFEICT